MKQVKVSDLLHSKLKNLAKEEGKYLHEMIERFLWIQVAKKENKKESDKSGN